MEYKLYLEEIGNWPKEGNHIMASQDDDTIIVYQAYKPELAKAIINSQNFHSNDVIDAGYNLKRMTWIKTNFLWIMFRSNWATKKNQERILAIRIKKDGFDEILASSIICRHNQPKQRTLLKKPENESENSFEKPTKKVRGRVVLQWDPDHYPNGERVSTNRRAIQLGLKGDILLKFSNEFIVNIVDITDFVHEQHNKCLDSKNKFTDVSNLLVPFEKSYVPKDLNIAKHINLTL